jgi:predicted permease
MVAMLSLALGIGANTALFSVVDAILLKKLPVEKPEQLVMLRSTSAPEFSVGGYNGNNYRDPGTGRVNRTSFPLETVRKLGQETPEFSDIFAFGRVNLNANVDGQASVVRAQAVTGNYYSGLGVNALHGRVLSNDDDRRNASPVAVISHRYWQRQFAENIAAVGKQINLNNVAFTIVGITPAGFHGAMDVGTTEDVTIPISMEPVAAPEPERSRLFGAGAWWLRVMGRIRPGVSPESARRSIEAPFHESVVEHRAARQALAASRGQAPMPSIDPTQYPRLELDPGGQGEMDSRRSYARPLYLLLGVVGLVLLIACANVANLLLGRASSRRKEIGVRLALGASRFRLIRQLLTESMLLAVFGGGLGVLAALWIQQGLISVTDWGGGDMIALNPTLDVRVLSFTLALSLLTGIVFGIAPAWRATKVDLSPSLKESGRGSSAGSRSLLNRGLVVTQVALSLLVLIGAGIFLRTLINLQNLNPGFNTNNLLLFHIEPGLIGYKGENLGAFYHSLMERMEGLPGVERATFSRHGLLTFSSGGRPLFIAGSKPGAEGRLESAGIVQIHQVRENFLETMEIPLLAGRQLSPQDQTTAPRVAIVNQAFARRFCGNESPIGKRFGFEAARAEEIEIVGVARDAKYSSQREDIEPTTYLPYLQELRGLTGATVALRSSVRPSVLGESVRKPVRELDSRLPVEGMRTQVEQAEQTLAMERLFAKLLASFGLLALYLAATGIYGVLAYSVAQRTNEIGIRMALGAQPPQVLRLVLRQGMTLVFLGLALGLVSAYYLSNLLERKLNLSSMLYGVSGYDPLTYGAFALFLTMVALVACYVPARRAARVDPMVALHYE